MKRRSARPFTVEVKHTRTSRAPIGAPVAWALAGLTPKAAPTPLAEAREPRRPPPLDALLKPAQPDALARRVLPSLVPMSTPSPEPELQVEEAEPRPPRVRRPRANGVRSPVAAEPSPARTQTPPFAAEPVAIDLPTAEPRTAARRSCLKRAFRREIELRPGERWKHRLPGILR